MWKSTQWKVQYMVHESNMVNTVSACWCQNRLTYVLLLVQIHRLLHFEQFISLKTTYIFCLIFLQTLISVIKSTWLTLKICWRRVTRNFFMDNFDLLLLNNILEQTDLLPIFLSFVHIIVLKLLWRKYFLKIIYRLSHCY